MPKTLCPYCGHTTPSANATRCESCNGLFESLSQQATQLAMGPWFVRDENRPFMPGFSTAILQEQAKAGKIKADTIVRGPTTNQFWKRADQVPGLSRLLGKCHSCGGTVGQQAERCTACQADQSLPIEVDRLGLSYVEIADRQRAQEEINARRSASPSKPKPAPQKKPKPAVSKPLEVDPALMQPVAAAPTKEPEQPEPAYEAPESVDIAEDLWHAAPSSPSRRRRKRNKGADPIALGLGVLLLCMVAGAAIFVILDGGPNKELDGEAASANKDKPKPPTKVQRTETDVQRVASPIISAYEQLDVVNVPPQLAGKLSEIAALLKLAEKDRSTGKLNDAYERYEQAQAQITPLKQAISEWEDRRRQAQDQTEALQLVERVKTLQTQASSANAQKWSPTAWSEAQASDQRGSTLVQQAKYKDAVEALVEAELSYQMSLGHARAAVTAIEARDALDAAIKAGQPEAELRKYASQQIDRVNTRRAEGEDMLSRSNYTQAEEAFIDATESYQQAQKAVELSQYSKVNAFNAGFNAAGILLGIASGDGIDETMHSELVKAYEQLALPNNPATSIKPGQEAEYERAAANLVIDVREAIKKMHGEPVQACYHAGFQARIIDQTLQTPDLSDAQRKRIHQSLEKLERQASDAGWAMQRFSSLVNPVRDANRNAQLNAPPTLSQAAWQRLIKPMKDQDYALRLMDPKRFPSDPGNDKDPDLFPDA